MECRPQGLLPYWAETFHPRLNMSKGPGDEVVCDQEFSRQAKHGETFYSN